MLEDADSCDLALSYEASLGREKEAGHLALAGKLTIAVLTAELGQLSVNS